MKQEPDFEGDRVVIRENEDAKMRKQGWFSKRAKTLSRSSAPSRPPTAASVGLPGRQALSKSQEDDLPPRTDATSTPLSASFTGTDATPISPKRRSSDSAPEIPVHAGFDLAAIKHMIGEAEHHPELLVVPRSKPDQVGSELPPTLPNSISSPPLSPPTNWAETVTGAVKPDPYDDVDEAGTSSRDLPDGLGSTFTTSLTLHDRDSFHTTEKAPDEAKLCSESGNALSRPIYPLEMGPPGWSSMNHFSNTSDTTLGSPFAGPSERHLFGSSTRSLAQSRYSHDRLGRLGAQSATDTSPGLSFGSPDGTITFQAEPDPWRTPAESRNTTSSGLGMNPWSI